MNALDKIIAAVKETKKLTINGVPRYTVTPEQLGITSNDSKIAGFRRVKAGYSFSSYNLAYDIERVRNNLRTGIK